MSTLHLKSVPTARLYWFVFGTTLVLGCAAFQSPSDEPRPRVTSRMSPDSVGLEYGFIRVSAEQASRLDAVWSEVDETRISPVRRQLLLDNGLRVGIVGEQLPPTIRQLLDAPSTGEDTAHEIAFEIDAQGRKEPAREKPFRHLHSRSGRPNLILASDILPQLDVLAQRQGLLVGRSFRDAQCVFLLKTYPLEDGRVRLELTPEIHHGTAQRDIVADTGIWRFGMSKKREVYASLRSEAILSPGESLLVTPTSDSRGLGKNFLVPHSKTDSLKGKMLIIRLAQTQHDALFSYPLIR